MFTAHQFTVFQLHKPVANLLETAFSALSWLGQQCRLIRTVLQHALFLDLFLGLMLREVWRHHGIYIWVCLCQMTWFNKTLKPWLVMWVYCSNKDVGNKSSLTFSFFPSPILYLQVETEALWRRVMSLCRLLDLLTTRVYQ